MICWQVQQSNYWVRKKRKERKSQCEMTSFDSWREKWKAKLIHVPMGLPLYVNIKCGYYSKKTQWLCNFLLLWSSHTRYSGCHLVLMAPFVHVALGLSKLKHNKEMLVLYHQVDCRSLLGNFGEVIKVSTWHWDTTAGNPSNVTWAADMNAALSRICSGEPVLSRLLFIISFSWLFGQETRELRHGFITRLQFWNVAWE